MKRISSPFDAVVVSLCFLLAAAVLTGMWWNQLRGTLFIPSSAYRTTQGAITQSAVVHSSGKGGRYRYQIHYVYSVAGRSYSSAQVSFGSWGGSSEFAQSYVDKYPVGRQVPVYYKFNEPAFAVLEPQTTDGSRLIFGFIAALCCVSLGFLGYAAVLGQRRTLKDKMPDATWDAAK